MVNVSASPCRVLLIDDDPGDAHLVRQMLRSAPGGNFEVSWASSLGEARQHLQKDLPEILLLDLSLPDSTGLATVHASRQAVGTLPLIVLTGHDDNALALQTLEAGAQDYLVKGSFDAEMLTRAIRYAISRSRLEARLHDAEERWRFALEGAGDGVWDWNLVIDKIEFSPRLNSMLGLADGDARQAQACRGKPGGGDQAAATQEHGANSSKMRRSRYAGWINDRFRSCDASLVQCGRYPELPPPSYGGG